MAFVVLAAPVLAEEYSYGPPTAVCLNKYTIPYINTDRPAIEIVDEATISVRTFLLSGIRKGSHYLPSLLSAKIKSFTHFTSIWSKLAENRMLINNDYCVYSCFGSGSFE